MQRYPEIRYLRRVVARTFLKNFFWLQALNWLIKPIWILWIERTVQVKLGNEWYGQYFVHFNLGLLFSVLLDAGLNAYISKEVASNGRFVHFKRVLKLRLGLGSLYIIAVAIFSWLQNLNSILIFWVITNQILASVTLFIRSVLQGKHQFFKDSVLSITDRFVAIILCSYWLINADDFFGFEGIIYFLLSQFAGYIVAILLGLTFLIFSKSGLEKIEDFYVENNTLELRPWLKQVGWFVLMALFMSFFTRFDALLIRSFSPTLNFYFGEEPGFFQAGIYAQGYRLLDAALIFSLLMSTQLLPIFTKKITQRESNNELLWGVFRLILLVGLSVLLFSITHGKQILFMMYGSKWLGSISLGAYSYQVFIFLMISFIPMAMIHIFGTYVTAEDKLKFLTYSALIALVVNIGLNLVLIPKFGALGAAYSSVFTQLLFLGFCISKTIKSNYFTWKKDYSIKLTAILLGFLLFSVPLVLKTYVLLYIPDSYNSDLLNSQFVINTIFLAGLAGTLYWVEIKRLIFKTNK